MASSPRPQPLEQLILESKGLTKTEQHLLMLLRVSGKIEGWRKNEIYKNMRFYYAMKNLINSKWVKQTYRYNEKGAPMAIYRLTRRGYEFNSELMQHCNLKPIWDKLPKKVIM